MKAIKKIGTLVLVMVMSFVMVQTASAATYEWASIKNPGNAGCVASIVEMPVYAGAITFKTTVLNGNCSYLAGKAEATYPTKYYINNSSRSVLISTVNGEQSFTMKFINFDISEDSNMYLSCTVVHNANIGDTVYARGIIYH